MGQVSPRLRKLYDTVRSDAKVTVIVTLTQNLDPSIIEQARATGAGPVRFQSERSDAFGIDATQAQAQAIARLPGVEAVWPNDPTVALGGDARGLR